MGHRREVKMIIFLLPLLTSVEGWFFSRRRRSPSPVHGHWGGWHGWGGCSRTCGGGTRSRSRYCNNPSPAHGGRGCLGSSTDTGSCNTGCCPVHGNWGAFGGWNGCSKTCGGGTQSRSRSCNNPSPYCGGQGCSGSSIEHRGCNTGCCPVHGNWGAFGGWSECSKTCGGGSQSRNRSCNNPSPYCGGRACSGLSIDTRNCSTLNCPVVIKPDPPVVSYSIVQTWDPFIQFKCEFHRNSINYPAMYEVLWYMTQPSDAREQIVFRETLQTRNVSYPPGRLTTNLTGNYVFAKVRMWYTVEPHRRSEYAISPAVYTGIEVQPPSVILTVGKAPVDIKVRPNLPITCKGWRQDCNMTIFFDITNEQRDVTVYPCQVVFKANKTLKWKMITLRARREVVNTGVTIHNLRWSHNFDQSLASGWNHHSPIYLKVRRDSLSAGRCTSTGVSHIRTFDGDHYDHSHVGYFVLVKSTARNFQVHVQTQKCAGGFCNCGVTVKEGDDVLSINMCGKYSAPHIQYLSNREPQPGTRIEQSPNGKTFIIKLASTASVKFAARSWSTTFYADVTVQLPAADFNQTVGLCGSMDGLPGNDRNTTVRYGCGSQACSLTESWRVPTNESLFCSTGGTAKCLEEGVIQKEHTCDSSWTTSSSSLREKDQMTRGYRKMVFSGQQDCDAARNITTQDNVIILPEGYLAQACDDQEEEPTPHHPMVPRFPTPSGLTEDNATSWCQSHVKGSRVYIMCTEELGNAFPVGAFVSQCIEDIKILDDQLVGLQSAMEALKSLCEDAVLKNETTDHENLLENLCPNECTFKGRCENGTCICNVGFTSEDCSVTANQIPEIDNSGILCDVRKSSCLKVKVKSNKLNPGRVICGMSSNDGASFSVRSAELINFAEVMCKLHKPGDVKDRYLTTGIPMATYIVSLSNNNGKNYSRTGLPVVVYDSKCMVCLNATAEGRKVKSQCRLKENTCLINGYCYSNGDVDPKNPNCRSCDPSRSSTMFLIGRDKPIECRNHHLFNLQCERESLTATWETGGFITNAPLAVSLQDPRCNVFYQNLTHTWITTNLTDCGTFITQHGDVIIQQNIATVTVSYGNKYISRKTSYVYTLSCSFNRKLNVMTANSFIGSDRVLEAVRNETSEFSASIAMYHSSSYLQMINKNPVPVVTFEPMYFRIKWDNENEELKLVVDQCFAVPVIGAQDVKYVFYDMKCPLDPTFKINSYSNQHFNFEIEAFNFIRIRKAIRVHCKLLVCKANSGLRECQQECAPENRKRREAVEVLKSRSKRGVEEESESIQTLDVETSCDITYREKKTCKYITCPTNSKCLELYPAECRCNDGFVRDTSTRQCKKEHQLIARGVHIEMPYLPTYDDPRSIDYLRMVTRVENQLLEDLDLDDTIKGLKVIEVYEGSVVADVALIYSKSMSKEEAFTSFSTSTMSYAQRSTGTIRLKPNTTLTLDTEDPPEDTLEGVKDKQIANDKKEVGKKVPVLMIGVLVVGFVAIVSGAVVAIVCYRRNCIQTKHGVDNNGNKKDGASNVVEMKMSAENNGFEKDEATN